jgi:ATP-dependent helicase/nuclease subunit B
MAGRLVCGEYRALEPALWDEIARLQDGRPLAAVTVVAPSARLVRHLKRAAARRFPGGLFGVRFATLFQLALDLAGDDAGRFEPAAIVHEALLLAWLEGPGATDAVFAGAEVGGWELAGALHAAVRDLRDAAVDVDPGVLLEALRGAARAPGSRLGELDVRKLGALLAAHRDYAARLARHGLADRAAVFRAAAARAARLRGPIVVYGFYDLTQVQADLVGEIIRQHPVTLLAPHGGDAATWRFGDWLREVWTGQVAGRVERLAAPAPAPRPALATAVGEGDEAWLCAKRIRPLLDAGCPPDEIAVVARTLDAYLPALAARFAEHHIPFEAPARRTLEEEPLVQAILRLFRAELDGLPRAAVLDAVCHPVFRGADDRRHWPLLARTLRIACGTDWARLDGAAGVTCRRGSDDDGRVPAAAVRGLRRAVARVRGLALPAAASWTAHAAAHRAALRAAFVPARLRPPERDAFQAVVAILDVLGRLRDAGRTVPRRRFIEAFERECRRRRLERPENRGVQVLDAMAARGLAFRHVVVLGMNARVFPRFIVEEPFVSDAVRREVIRVLGHHVPVRADAYDEERLLFHLVTTAATESLLLLRQRADAEGRLRDASPFVRPLLAAAALVDDVPRGERAKLARGEVRTPRELVLGAADPETALFALGQDALAFRRARDVLRALDADGGVSPFEGRVGPGVAVPRRMSATRLERYAGCPFRYFTEDVLRVAADEDEADDLSPLERGTLLHDTLERLYRDLAARGFPRDTLAADVARAAAGAAAAFAARDGAALRGMLAVRVAEAVRLVAAYVAWDLEQHAVREPVAFEVAGEAMLGGLRLAARLDRVDRDRATGALRVVDYKSRWREDWRRDLAAAARRGEKLQAPVYLEAARTLDGGAVTETAFHFVHTFATDVPAPGGDPGARFVRRFGADEWEACRADVEQSVATLARFLAEGWFFLRVRDGEFEPCTRCGYRTVCRKNHLGLRARPARTPELAPFFAVVE